MSYVHPAWLVHQRRRFERRGCQAIDQVNQLRGFSQVPANPILNSLVARAGQHPRCHGVELGSIWSTVRTLKATRRR
jgi:hypothetical protein